METYVILSFALLLIVGFGVIMLLIFRSISAMAGNTIRGDAAERRDILQTFERIMEKSLSGKSEMMAQIHRDERMSQIADDGRTARAAIEGLYQRGGVFERTPKYRIEDSGDRWDRKIYRARPDLSALVEGLFAAYFTLSVVLAWMLEMWSSLPFLYLFLYGYWYIFLLTLLGGRRFRRRQLSAEGAAQR